MGKEPWTERFWNWLAHCLPHRLVYFVGIRLWVNATTGQWSNTVVPCVTMDTVLRRWEQTGK